jgi:hypothetical protein
MPITLPVSRVAIIGRDDQYDEVNICCEVPRDPALEPQRVTISIRLKPGTAEAYMRENFPLLVIDRVLRLPKLSPFHLESNE